MSDNPLLPLAEFPDFAAIRPEHAAPAVDALIATAETQVAEIERRGEPTWEGRIVALREATTPLSRVWGVVMHLVSVANCDAWRKVEEALQPRIVTFFMRVVQSRPLYDALLALRGSPAFDGFDRDRQRVIDTSLKGARQSGVGLDGEEKERFNAIVQELSALSMKFSNNVIDATKRYSMTLRSRDDVAGLPGTLLEACAEAARKSGEVGATPENGPWRVSLEHAVLAPFMQYAERRDLREQLLRASLTRASSGELDNGPIIERILALRREMATLAGYADYAALSLDMKMAGSADPVYALFDRVGSVVMEKAQAELVDLQRFAEANGFDGGKLRPWDTAYWSRRQVEVRFGYSPEALRPYLPFEHVLSGLFALVEKLVGARIAPADGEAPVWHPDVRFFRVTDKAGDTLAWFYLDPYSRPETKRGGAWMNEFQTREVLPDGAIRRPIALIVCNQAVPAAGKPSCMTPSEIATLFHEFGHALQHMLTRVDIPEASGINNIEWDAVEVASQFLENWSRLPDVLRSLSRHVETGEPLDDDTLERIHASDTHNAAMGMARQLRFGLVDMDLHAKFPSETHPTIAATEAAASRRFSVLPRLPEDRSLCTFAHVFAGGYAAGYYSYLWAEVLAADVFLSFLDAGIEDDEAIQRLGKRYAETFLACGGGEHPMDVFRAFSGREPNPVALLRLRGLAS
ncbi:MAG: M3 family metallopeptidase [Kiritimatiellia bacterium]|jgi:oligopeptidase A